LNPDFRDMLSALSEAGAEYLLVGAYALAVHGHPRATGDLDLWVRPHPDNAPRVLAALRAFGAPTGEMTAEDLCRPGLVFQIGVAPVRIDLLTAIDGVEWDPAWNRRQTQRLAGLDVPVLGRDDLIRNKRATGRDQDLTDARRLEGDR
jgi:hypothetical protein